ncbi:MAG: tetratricopeptide repeat protein [Actinobacteria bacterium]|nr:tetratricopeptide repeat protein [Actinomycetota bacterium]
MKRISTVKILLAIFAVLGLMLLITAFGPQGCENKGVAASTAKGSSLTQSTSAAASSSVSSSSTSSNETIAQGQSQDTGQAQVATYLTEADSLYASGDFYKALRAYKRVLTVDPTNAVAKERVAQLEKLIAGYETYYNLGMELWYKQNFSEALKEFEKALALYPASKMAQDSIKTLKQILGIS